MTDAPLLEAIDVATRFPVRRGLFARGRGHVHAVDGVSFALNAGETIGLVGESGSGKSTLGRTVLRLLAPSAGRIRLAGTDITDLDESALRPLRRRMQLVFQDPYSSLNPRRRVGASVAEPLIVHGLCSAVEARERAQALFARVGLRPEQFDAYPNEFSGGQRQRLAIARALALAPDLIVADEPVSALDVSVRAQVINLLIELQEERGLAYLFIAHDLAVVAHISHRIAVMYLGRIVELAESAELFARPLHPYTQALIEAVPVARAGAAKRRTSLREGEIPSPVDRPPGCHFHTRCPHALPRCRSEAPALREVGPARLVACHLP
ncbi:MAG: dipeptide ABC transporter ATP-binding protein [Alphaproteobacteria bacterium]|nr:dipeptide ABC transporter ATP-binding protein [Alphaproteobacteria bacterium]